MWGPLAAAAVAAALALPAGFGHPPAAPLRVPGGLAGLALEGPTLVVAGGGRDLLITPLDRGTPYHRRACPGGFVHDGLPALAFSGGRLAWLCRGPAGPRRVRLLTASLVPRAAVPQVLDAAPGLLPRPTGVAWVGALVGGGGQIAYAHGDLVPHPFLIGDHPVPFRGADALTPLAVSSRYLVLAGSDGLHVRTGPADIHVPIGGPPLAAALDGEVLDVVVPGALEIHHLDTGAALSVPVPAARLVTANGGLAMVGAGGDVVAVEEATGARWLVASSSLPIVAVGLSRFGVVYGAQRPAFRATGYVSSLPLRFVRAARRRQPPG